MAICFFSSPRQPPFNLHFQAEAKKGSDGDDPGQHSYALERKLYGNRIDYVGSNQELEPEKYGTPKVGPKISNSPLTVKPVNKAVQEQK
jgi:hypothetical protein